MYIICPQCQTRFVVKPDQLGPKGKKAKCVKCQFIWFAEIPLNQEKPEPESKQEVIPESITNNISQHDTWLPAVVYSNQHKHDSNHLYKWIVGVIVILILLLTEAIDHGYFGYNNDLVVSNTYSTKQHNGNTMLHYTITNNTKHQMDLPIIRFRFFNKHHKLIQRSLIENNVVKIAPGETITLRREFKVDPFSSFDVTLGSKLDFVLSY